MPSISDAVKDDSFMGLFIGRPGKGKSIGAASFPKPMYIFDLDGRIKPVARFFGDEDITFDTYLPQDFSKFYAKLKELVLNCKYKTVILDSYTALADMLITYSINLRGNDNRKTDKGVISMTEISDFNAETQGLQSTVAMLRTIKCQYKIMNAHMLLTEYYDLTNQKTRILKSVLTAGKKVSEKVPAYFDNVWYFYTKDSLNASSPPDYCVRTVPREDDNIKSAINVSAELIFSKSNSNPKGSLFKLIEGK